MFEMTLTDYIVAEPDGTIIETGSRLERLRWVRARRQPLLFGIGADPAAVARWRERCRRRALRRYRLRHPIETARFLLRASGSAAA